MQNFFKWIQRKEQYIKSKISGIIKISDSSLFLLKNYSSERNFYAYMTVKKCVGFFLEKQLLRFCQ